MGWSLHRCRFQEPWLENLLTGRHGYSFLLVVTQLGARPRRPCFAARGRRASARGRTLNPTILLTTSCPVPGGIPSPGSGNGKRTPTIQDLDISTHWTSITRLIPPPCHILAAAVHDGPSQLRMVTPRSPCPAT